MRVVESVRIAIADDQPFHITGLQNYLQSEPDFLVVGYGNNGADLLQIIEDHQPHIVLTDLLVPEMDAVPATKIALEKYPLAKIIAFSMRYDDLLLLDMLRAGAKGYLLKNSPKEEVKKAIYAVHNGGIYYCCEIFNRMIKTFETHVLHHPEHSNGHTQLSEREVNVIKMICQEFSSKEMAYKLNVSIRAVESIRERLQGKIGAKNMIGIAMYAVKHGMYVP